MSMECPECGLPARPDDTFCRRCNAFLQWTALTPPVGAGPSPVMLPDPRDDTAELDKPLIHPQRGGDAQTSGVHVSFSGEDWSVDPGSVISIPFVLRNTGTQVEEIRLAVEGPPWLQVHPTSVSVYPGEKGSGVLQGTPPRDSSSLAGDVRFRVTATASLYEGVMSSAGGRLHVSAFHQFDAELVPTSTRGRTRTWHRLELSNQGNIPIRAVIEATDPEGALQVSHPRTVDVLPGQVLEVPVAVQAAPAWFGQPQTKQFVVAVDPGGGQAPVRLSGSRTVLPRFPMWVPVAVGAVLAVALAAGVYTMNRAGQTGDSSTGASGEASVIATAGAGPSGAAPITVPDLAGKTVSEAADQLGGLNVLARSKVDNSAPKDTVISSDPRPGTEVAPGGKVVLTVSAGPTPPVDLVAAAPTAAWQSGAGTVSFDGDPADPAGSAFIPTDPTLENQTHPSTLIETRPQAVPGGFIQGAFQLPAQIIAGDHFRADVGFLAGGQGQVTFDVRAQNPRTGATAVVAKLTDDATDGQVRSIDVDLTQFAGDSVLVLRVTSAAQPTQDDAVWVAPRVTGG